MMVDFPTITSSDIVCCVPQAASFCNLWLRSVPVERLTWWQAAVFYQIYPRSFADGNADGIGDFVGMAAKLDYLCDLGINAVWLSPHYPSPLLDCGYDISDYTGVAPEYGTLADFTAFLHAAHARGIHVILDLVLNHTSDQHPWFQESRASRDNPKRDWYIWRDGKDGGPPNNWVSIFGGSAWDTDAATDQWYYHAFLRQQPDLNWRNPAVKRAMWDAVRFWLDLGVDGFRLDAIAMIFEHPELPDHTATRTPDAIMRAMATAQTDAEREAAFVAYRELLRYQMHQPGVHALLRELRALVASYPGDRVLVGEDDDVAYLGTGTDELHLVFNFPLMQVQRLTPEHIRTNQAQRLAALPPGAWPCNTLGNHDTPRVWDRYGDGVHDAALARVHLALLLTLRGTPFLYNGEELGMTNLALTTLSQVRDTSAIRLYQLLTEDLDVPPSEAEATALSSTRDRCRSPLQWRYAPNAGFCPADITPWLPVNPNYAAGVNAADQATDPASLLTFYRRMLHLRQASPALVAGDYTPLPSASEGYLVFLRHDDATGQTYLVALNFTAADQHVSVDLVGKRAEIRFTSHARADGDLAPARLTLAPFEVLVAELR
jgi:alpha-glucosidase